MDALRSRQKKLLIIHQGSLGDFILTFPAIIGLKHSYQQIDVLCQKKLGELASELSLIANAYALESGAFATFYSDHLDRIDQLLGPGAELAETCLLGKLIERDVVGSFLALGLERVELVLQGLDLFL